MAGCLCVRASMDSSYKLYSVPTPAGSETTPNASFEVNPKGCRIVSAVERTRADELIVFGLEPGVQSVGGKNPSDGDMFFKIAEAIGIHGHSLFMIAF